MVETRAAAEVGHLRAGLLLDALAGVDPTDAELMLDWISGQPDDVVTRVSVDAGLRVLRWDLGGPPEPFLRHGAEFLVDVGAPEAERSRRQEVVSACDPSQVATWLGITAHGLDGGWSLHDAGMPAPSIAISGFDLHELAATTLLAWLDAHGLTDVLELRRGVGGPAPVLELLVDLGPLGSGRLAAFHELARSLGVRAPGDDVAEVLEQQGATSWDLEVALTSEGVSRLAVRVPQPTRPLSILLGTVAHDEVHVTLARVEGTLGADAPDAMTFGRDAGGWTAWFHYVL